MGITSFGIKWRQLIHKPLLSIFSLTLKHKIKLLHNDYIPNGKPTIFAMTHAFKDDAICVPYVLSRQVSYLKVLELAADRFLFLVHFVLNMSYSYRDQAHGKQSL